MNSVLLYPSFFPSQNWLRVAALCWDSIYTLRPPLTRAPEEVEKLDRELGGILVPVDVREFSNAAGVIDNFAAWIAENSARLSSKQALCESRLIMLDGLFGTLDDRQQFADLLRRHGLFTESELAVGRLPRWEFEPRLTFPESVYIHIDYRQEQRVREEYWGAVARGDRKRAAAMIRADRGSQTKRWHRQVRDFLDGRPEAEEYAEDVVFMPPEVPFHFLALCASSAASRLGSDLASETDAYTRTCLYGKGHITADISIELLKIYVPEDLATIDPSRLRDLRNELSTSRLKYQKDVQAVIDEFAKLFSEHDLTRAKSRILDVATSRVEETRKAYQRSRIAAVLKSFGFAVTPPAILAGLASALSMGIFAPAAIGAALSLLIAERLLDLNKAESDRRSAAFSYVFEIKTSFHRLPSKWLRSFRH